MDIVNSFSTYLTEDAKDKKTIEIYRHVASDYVSWIGDEQKVLQAKPITIKEYIINLRHDKKLSAVTINKYIAGLNAFYYYIEENGFLKINPMSKIKGISIADNFSDKNKWLTYEEQDRFFMYADLEKNEWLRIRNMAIIDLMLYAGLRVQEASDLYLGDVTANKNDLNIVVRDGKKGKYAVVTLLHKHARNLKSWLQIRAESQKPYHLDSNRLFLSERSGQLGPRSIHKFVKKYGELAGMPDVSPHTFRHSFCKNLARQNTPIEIIRRLARHERIDTTSIYIDPSTEELVNALKRM